MNTSLKNSLVAVATSICEDLEHYWKHVSFVIDRRSIISVGWNQPFKTHPMANKFGYRFNAIHSELHAILKFARPVAELYKYKFVNIRIDKFGKLKLSKPCKICQTLLYSFGVKEVEYTNCKGEFECLQLNK